jgi:hypothetical protein
MRSDNLRFEIKEIKIDLLLTKNIYVKGKVLSAINVSIFYENIQSY